VDGAFSWIHDFYSDLRLIDAAAELRAQAEGRQSMTSCSLVFTGCRAADPQDGFKRQALSRSETCCAQITEVNRDCYRAQCFATARTLIARLKLDESRTALLSSRDSAYTLDSAFLRSPLRDVTKRGIRHLAVVCPSFVADCLETLEEVQIRGRDQFLAAGGERARADSSNPRTT